MLSGPAPVSNAESRSGSAQVYPVDIKTRAEVVVAAHIHLRRAGLTA